MLIQFVFSIEKLGLIFIFFNIDAGIGQKGFREILAKPEGPVFFAGEHTAIQRASMNGAIESGMRVTEELKRADIS